MQKQLGIKRYEPVWTMVYKLRKVIEKMDRWKSAAGKQNVALIAKFVPLEGIETGETSKSSTYFKAKVLEYHRAEEINETIRKSIEESSIVFTDQNTSYVDIAGLVEIHIPEKSTKQTIKETLEWVHIFIRNAKKNLIGN